MRHTLRALVGLALAVCCCQTWAEEARSRWWPFGGSSDAEASHTATAAGAGAGTPAPSYPQTAPSPDTDTEAERRWMISSQRGKVSWPRVHMPELPKPRLPRPQFFLKNEAKEDSRNAWYERQPEPSRTSPMEAMGEASRKAADRTRAAWQKTVDVLTPGDGTSNHSRMAQRNSRPPLWKRMFGADEPRTQGPQTITEWMAQERLDP